jgi:hypothetical protein
VSLLPPKLSYISSSGVTFYCCWFIDFVFDQFIEQLLNIKYLKPLKIQLKKGEITKRKSIENEEKKVLYVLFFIFPELLIFSFAWIL